MNLIQLLTPRIQAVATVGIGLIIMLVVSVLRSGQNYWDIDLDFYWMTAASMLYFFMLVNCALIIASAKSSDYYKASMPVFALTAVVLGTLAYAFSGISIQDTGQYLGTFVLISVVYLILMGMMTFIKHLVFLAENDVWTEPKRRNKHRRH